MWPLHRLSLELLHAVRPDNERKRLYQLVLGGRPSVADSKSRITWLLESSLDPERTKLHTLLVNHKSLRETEFQQITNYLIEMATDKESETLLNLVLKDQCLLVRHYDEMITWLVQDPHGDVNDWTTVKNMTIYLLKLNVLPESEATCLYPLITGSHQPSSRDYKDIIIRLLGPSLKLQHQQLHKRLIDHDRDDRIDYKSASIWLLERLPNTRRNILYRQVVENRILDDSHDTMIGWLLGLTPEEGIHSDKVPDEVFYKVSSLINPGVSRVDRNSNHRTAAAGPAQPDIGRISPRTRTVARGTIPVDYRHLGAELEVIEAYIEEPEVWRAPRASLVSPGGYLTPTSIYSIGNPFGELEQDPPPLVWPTFNDLQ